MSRLPSLSQQYLIYQQILEITPDYYLHIHDKSLTQEHEQYVDLFDLEFHPETLNTSSSLLLLLSSLWMLSTLIGLIFSLFQGFEGYLLWLLTSFGLTVMCSLLFFMSQKTLLLYRHRYTQQPLFAIRVFQRNKAQREIFVQRFNTLLQRLSEYDRQSFYARQTNTSIAKDGLSYN